MIILTTLLVRHHNQLNIANNCNGKDVKKSCPITKTITINFNNSALTSNQASFSGKAEKKEKKKAWYMETWWHGDL